MRADDDVELTTQTYPTVTAGLAAASFPVEAHLMDRDELDLRIVPVRKRLGNDEVRMLGYNGSVPGPTIVMPEGATVAINVTNHGDLETTVHWHGLRLENRYDGTHETQAPIPLGATFRYEIHAPDPGIYWYHPHIREDYAQEVGLYGNIIVVPARRAYWPPANRELALTLDDVLIEDGRIAPFSRAETTHVAMGRFGNIFLVGGEDALHLSADLGEVVRLYLTNTANTRVFNVALPGGVMKLVGADGGHHEHEAFVDEVLLAPSERAVVDVLFDEAGEHELLHRTPQRTYRLALVTVSEDLAEQDHGAAYRALRTNADMVAERERLASAFSAPPDKTLAFVAEMDFAVEDAGPYVCPMHPEVTSDSPATCPKCGMKLVSASLVPGGEHRHPSADPDHPGTSADAIEWEDDMVDINRLTTPTNVRWKIVEQATGAENDAIAWSFRVGEEVKIRLVNEVDSDHPMPHPFHVHGAGRFLILSRDGVDEQSLVWKDTVFVRTGETVDILLQLTNVGRWMAHCHIAEHHEGGMMFSFDVTES